MVQLLADGRQDLLTWCRSHAARVQWGTDDDGQEVMQVAVPEGGARTRVVVARLGLASDPWQVLNEAVALLDEHESAVTLRSEFRIVRRHPAAGSAAGPARTIGWPRDPCRS